MNSGVNGWVAKASAVVAKNPLVEHGEGHANTVPAASHQAIHVN